MKKINTITFGITIICLLAVIYSFKPAEKSYVFKTITIVESIVPSGLGRSRIINTLEPKNYKDYTKTMTNADKKRNQTKRKDIRVKNYEETKLLNFYNLGGIRFQNIAANDAVVDSRVNAFLDEGWEIISINTGVEAYSGQGDANGLYVTRMYFKKPK